MEIRHALRSHGRRFALAAVLAAFSLCLFAGAGKVVSAAAGNQDIALSMAALLRSARAVVSDNQSLINDPDKGDKGFTGEVVRSEAKLNYRLGTGIDLDSIDPSSLQGELLQAEMDAIVEIVNEWQDRINKKGVAYKGFLPAVFAFQVTQRFKQKKGKVAEIKLTAPADYVRNERNMPDSWEQDIIEARFRSPDHPFGQYVAGMADKRGRTAYRLILPEYYQFSCLSCHGEPKGATDRTGGKKEGGTLGALGGAISVVIYDKS